jgi:hypothetical protein
LPRQRRLLFLFDGYLMNYCRLDILCKTRTAFKRRPKADAVRLNARMFDFAGISHRHNTRTKHGRALFCRGFELIEGVVELGHHEIVVRYDFQAVE